MHGIAARRGDERAALVEAAARWAPALIAAYAAGLVALRVALSPFLEIDEAQFVGAVDLRLVYDNSHPPLYNWVLRGLLELTGWNWPLSAALLKYALLAIYHLCVWDAARRLGGAQAGLLALAAAALLPQVSWMSVQTLSHSVMVLAGAAAFAHATVLLWLRPSTPRWIWFGLSAVLGAMAKYNFYLFAAPLLLALAADPATRRVVSDRGAALALAVFAASVGPALAAAALAADRTTERLSKLYAANPLFGWLDAPGIGLDGALHLAAATVAWAGPLAAAWLLARRRDGMAAADAAAAPIVRALGRAMAIGLGAFAVGVLASDAHRVNVRYLTPILAALPIWLPLARPLASPAPRRLVLGLAAAAFAAAPVGYAAMAWTQAHDHATPYDAVAAEIARAGFGPAPIVGPLHVDVANLTLALRWPGTREPRYAPLGDRAILVWRGEGPPPLQALPGGLALASAPVTVRAPYRSVRSDAFAMSFALATR